MKATVCTAAGIAGAVISAAFGGWSTALECLIWFMAIDYATGVIVAGVFKKSKKTDSGSLKSVAGFKGLSKKCVILMLVMMGFRLDQLMGTTIVKDAVCIGFIVNEGLSILENVGLMGITYPEALKKALDVLNKKEAGHDGTTGAGIS